MFAALYVGGDNGQVADEFYLVSVAFDAGHALAGRTAVDEVLCVWMAGHCAPAVEDQVNDASP